MSKNVIVKIMHKDYIDKYDENILETYMPVRFKKAKTYKSETSQKIALATILLMKDNLDFEEKDIYYNEFKKPLLKDIYFNISHSGDYVALVKDDKKIGLDIQEMNEKKLSLKDYAFTSEEIEYINKNELTNFYELWTKKESLLKTYGTGFTTTPKEIGVNILENQTIYKGEKYYFISTVFENLFITVCSLNKMDNIIIQAY